MSNFFLSRQASQDLDAIADYFMALTRKCENLVHFPNLGRSYGHIRPEMRGIPLEGYIILYQVFDDGIEVLRVVGGRQDLEELFLG